MYLKKYNNLYNVVFKILSNYFIKSFLLSRRCAQKEVGQILKKKKKKTYSQYSSTGVFVAF